MSRGRALPVVALAAAVALTGRPAGAEELDYQLDHPEWNGLTDFAAVAGAHGLPIEQVERLDWKDLDPEKDLLLVIYPSELDGAEVASWVRAGGRLLIADDFGGAADAFLELGVRRRPAQGVRAARFHEENPALPVAESWADEHPLAKEASELYTNHPAVLEVVSDGGGVGVRPEVIFGFGKGEALVVAGELGSGRYVLLGDPSLLINGMLAFEENMAFAGNLADYLRPVDAKRGGRAVLLSRRFLLTGDPPEEQGGELGLPGANAKLKALGRWLRELNSYLGDDQALRAGAVLGAFLLLLVGMAVVPLSRRERLDGSWTRVAGGHVRIDVEELLSRYDDARFDGSFALPAAVAREQIEARLASLCGVAAPLELPDDELVKRVEQKAGRTAATLLADELGRLRSLPTREQALLLFGARVVSRREFERVYDAAKALDSQLSRVDS